MYSTTSYSVADEKSKTFQLRIAPILYRKALKLAALKGTTLAGLIKHLLLKEIEKENITD